MCCRTAGLSWLPERTERRRLPRCWRTCCDKLEWDAGFFIGGIPLDFERSSRLGAEGAPFVIEGDEYDSAFFEKVPKFWSYRADAAILTSIEYDHVDIFPDVDAYVGAFRKFVAMLPKDGWLFAWAGDPRCPRGGIASALQGAILCARRRRTAEKSSRCGSASARPEARWIYSGAGPCAGASTCPWWADITPAMRSPLSQWRAKPRVHRSIG